MSSLLPFDVGYLFGVIQLSPVDGCSAASCSFGVLTEDECMSFYSTILGFVSLSSISLEQSDVPCFS